MSSWVRAGLVGAAFSGGPSTAVSLLRSGDVLASTEAVGAVVLPRWAGRPARLLAGGATHLFLSLMWAGVLAWVLRGQITKRTSTRTGVAMAGGVCGLVIAALDLGLIGRKLPAIRSLPAGPQIADHVAYGALVGWTLKGR